MKKNALLILLFGFYAETIAQVGLNTPTPKSTMDVQAKRNPDGTIKGNNQLFGLQAPRITMAELTANTSIYGSGQDGALIYITDISGGGTSSGTQREYITTVGYYYFDSTAASGAGRWQKLINSNTQNSYTSNNGVSIVNNSVKLGGALTEPTTISATATNKLAITGTGADAINLANNTISVDAQNNRIGIGTNAPTEKLDINGKLKIRELPTLSGPTSALSIDENGVVGKTNVSSETKIAFYTIPTLTNSVLDYSKFNRGDEILVPISPEHESLNTIDATIPVIGEIKIGQTGKYLISGSIGLFLSTNTSNAKIFTAINIDASTDGGNTWTPISGARPIFILYLSAMNVYYTLPTVITNLNKNDRIRMKFYRSKAGNTMQGDNLSNLSYSDSYGGSPYILSLTKL